MDHSEKSLCLIISRFDLFQKVKSTLSKNYSLLHAINSHRADLLIRQHNIICTIVHIDDQMENAQKQLFHLSTLFPQMPVIGVTDNHDLETARICGKCGADHVVSDTDFQVLSDVILHTICEKSIRISWSEFGIDVDQCTPLVHKALNIFEERYIKIMSIQEVCDDLSVVPETLSREFKKCCKVGPKRVLMILKIRHAVYLMDNPGLSLKEIGSLLGYCNKRRFSECFQRLVGVCPDDFRKNYNQNQFIDLLCLNM